MFVREEPTKLDEGDVLAALVNDHDRRILAAAQNQPVEAADVVEATGIPRSTTYRRIRKLQEKGLLEAVNDRIRDGHRVERYRSAITVVELKIQDGVIETRWRPRDEDDDESPQPLEDRRHSVVEDQASQDA